MDGCSETTTTIHYLADWETQTHIANISNVAGKFVSIYFGHLFFILSICCFGFVFSY